MAPIALEGENHVDEVLEHARSRERPFLGDVPNEHEGRAGAARTGGEECRALAHLRDRARRRADAIGVDGLDRVDQHQSGLELTPGGGEALDAGRGQEPQVAGHAAQSVGTQTNLRRALLTAHVEDGSALLLEVSGELEREGRLANARLAAEQDHRARDQTAAQHPVELRAAAATASSGRVLATGPDPTRARGGGGASGSSTRLSQTPQDVQRPSQRGYWAPHSVQEKTVLGRATPGA